MVLFQSVFNDLVSVFGDLVSCLFSWTFLPGVSIGTILLYLILVGIIIRTFYPR